MCAKYFHVLQRPMSRAIYRPAPETDARLFRRIIAASALVLERVSSAPSLPGLSSSPLRSSANKRARLEWHSRGRRRKEGRKQISQETRDAAATRLCYSSASTRRPPACLPNSELFCLTRVWIQPEATTPLRLLQRLLFTSLRARFLERTSSEIIVVVLLRKIGSH